jgi:hypothetical protein
MAQNSTILGQNFIVLPSGTTAERPGSPTAGMLRFNTTASALETYSGTAWVFIDLVPGTIQDYPVTSISTFEAFSPSAGTYWIKPTGIATAFQVTYSGTNYRTSGNGFFRWYRTVDQSAPTENLIDNSYPWNLMMVEKEGSSWQTIGSNSNVLFNTKNSTETFPNGTRAGYRVFFGYAGGHGIYNTAQNTCSWGDSSGAIGAGWNGATCGSFPTNLIMGDGQASVPEYTNRGGTWSFWFRWI